MMKLSAVIVSATLLILLHDAAASTVCVAKTMTYDDATKALKSVEMPVDLNGDNHLCAANLARASAASRNFETRPHDVHGCVGKFEESTTLFCHNPEVKKVDEAAQQLKKAAQQLKNSGSCTCPPVMPASALARFGAFSQQLADASTAAGCLKPRCNGTVINPVAFADYSHCADNRDGNMCKPTCLHGAEVVPATGFTMGCDSLDNSYDGADSTLVCTEPIVCFDSSVQCWVDFKNFRYATLDGATPAVAVSNWNLAPPSTGCQDSFLPLPRGWEVVPGTMSTDNTFLSEVVAWNSPGTFSWATNSLVLSDGSSWITHELHGTQDVGSGHLAVSADGNSYHVTDCNLGGAGETPRRVFIRRPL